MTLKWLWLDGFSSRQYAGEWPGGAYSETPYGRAGQAAGVQDVYVGEGRFFGQAGGGRYGVYFGEGAAISFKDVSTAGLSRWFQWGAWMRWTRSDIQTVWNDYGAGLYVTPLEHRYGNVLSAPATGATGYWAWRNAANNYELYYHYGPLTADRILTGITNQFPLVYNKWVWVEVRVYGHTTAGVAELRLDGTQISRLTGVKTAQADRGWNAVEFETYDWSGSTDRVRWDDQYFVFADDESEMAWYGPAACEPLVPQGMGDVSDWSGSYTDVNELPANDADKLTAGPGNKQHLFTMSALDTSRARTIHAVKAVCRARKTNAGARKLRPICKVGGTVYNGDTQYVAPQWREIYHIWNLNPATGTAWTASSLASAQFGFEQVE